MFTPSHLSLQLFTASRLFFGIVMSILLVSFGASQANLIACFVLGFLSEMTDFFDGKIARKFNLVSDLGKFLDPFVDSISRLLVYFAMGHVGLCPVWVPMTMSVRDIVVAYVRIYSLQQDIVVSARFSGKFKALVQAFGGALLLTIPLFPIPSVDKTLYAFWVGVIVAAVTVWSMVDYAWSAIRLELGKHT